MMLTKWIFLGACYLFLMICSMETAKLVYRQPTIPTIKTKTANVVSVPFFGCPKGEALDHRGKCRTVVDDWK